MAATMFREIEEARALYELRAYQEARRELNLPKVEKVIDKEGRYLVTTFDRADGHELFHGEVGEQQLLEMLGHYIQQEERMRLHRAQSAMGGLTRCCVPLPVQMCHARARIYSAP